MAIVFAYAAAVSATVSFRIVSVAVLAASVGNVPSVLTAAMVKTKVAASAR